MVATMRQKLIPVLILIIGGILLACALYLAQPPKEIIIGFSGPLEGKYSDLGVEGRNAVIMAIEELNAKGGIHGAKLRLLSAHDGYTPKEAVSADNSLISHGAVAIIGHMTSAQMQAVLDAGVDTLYISPTASTYKLEGRDDNMFRMITSNAKIGQAAGEHAGSHGAKTAATIFDVVNEEYTHTYIDAAVQGFTKKGGMAIASIPFVSTDPSSILNAAKKAVQSKAEVIFTASSARDTALLLTHMGQMGYTGTRYSSSWALTPALISQGGSAVEGTIFAHPYPITVSRQEHKEFLDRFQARFGWKPGFPGVYSYSAMMLLTNALEKTKGSKEGLRDALKSIRKHDGLTSIITLDEYGDAHMPLYISTVKNGVFEALQ
ncbi:ABC transporter substrate-binding protein [Oleidesulfovibrio sp.]|uniref:ABC transporter substrate-binding protein n=1 Tax=Oleidesulfovibrio sp. TaxID=2909707 RepID=UPI003A83FA53